VMGTEFYWTVIVALCAGGWAMMIAVRDRKAQAIRHSNSIIDRLLESDKLIVENPDIQMYLSRTAQEDEARFRSPEVLNDMQFFKAKAYLYGQLNLFDEILSAAAQIKSSRFLLGPPEIIEIADWEMFIRHKLTHPMCRSILRNESAIFGRALQEFWRKHESDILAQAPDSYSW